MSKQPLAEVFGFPVDSMSVQASRHRKNKLCPYNNNVPNCTKDKANDPLGVCSIHYGKKVVITCPIRFRQEWLIADEAARFFFPEEASWTSLTEVRLKDAHGQSAGNIDVVLVAYDDQGQILDFGALEVQAVYISGNVRRPFAHYMEQVPLNQNDIISDLPYSDLTIDHKSTIDSLMQFFLNAGMAFNAWGKRISIATHKSVFSEFPLLPEIDRNNADLELLLYDLQSNGESLELTLERVVYTRFQSVLESFQEQPDLALEDAIAFATDLPSEQAFKSFIDNELKRITISEEPFWDYTNYDLDLFGL